MATRKNNPLSLDKALSPAPAKPQRSDTSVSVVPATEFMPHPDKVRTQTRYRYWVGLTPDCPVNNLTMAGLSFPKINERLVADPRRTGEKRRVPVIGALVWIDRQAMECIREQIPRTIMRMLAPVEENTRNMETVSDNVTKPQRGHLITIPSQEQIQQALEDGSPINHYNYDEQKDVPAARYMFAHLCEDQSNPQRGEFYPDTLDKTGLQWPEEL